MKTTILTTSNDTRTATDADLIAHWANRLYESTRKRDFALRGHLCRILPRGLRSRILVAEAQIAIACRYGHAN